MSLVDALRRHFRPEKLAGLPPIETTRLRLGALAPDDTQAVQRITDDPAVQGAIDFLPDWFGL